MHNKNIHNIKINEIWTLYNNRYMIYTEDGDTASRLELNYQLPPVAFYRSGEKVIGWQYNVKKSLAEKFARINHLEIKVGTLPKLRKQKIEIIDEEVFKELIEENN